MRDRIQFENIQSLRLQAGIEDEELLERIDKLHPGDVVNLTLPGRRPTLIAARITQVCGESFRARLIHKSGPSAQAIQATFVTFAACHIHSIARRDSAKRALSPDVRLLRTSSIPASDRQSAAPYAATTKNTETRGKP